MKGANTVAAAPKSAGHKGSPYAGDTTKLSTLDTSYVVTPGPGWADQTAASVCQNDVGAPLFRGTSAIAVAGVMANYTVFDPAKVLPVTVEHTRVDTTSKIGAWLTAQGVTTTHSCSGSCTKNTFDGGIPSPDGTKSTNASNGATAPGDASADALAAGDSGKKDSGSKSSSNNDNTADQPTGQVPLPPTPDESPPGPNDGGDVDGGPTKAAKKTGGCSAAPGESPSGSGLALGFGLAALAVVARRRRRS
jgi:MYXO-CTERM domain-containing protein